MSNTGEVESSKKKSDIKFRKHQKDFKGKKCQG